MLQPIITLDEMLALKEHLWPHVTFYDKQVQIIESWCSNRETVCVAGTELGKDFVAGFIAPASFLVCQAKGLSCKLLTLSVAEDHLKVLWGEIGRYLATSRLPLIAAQGGPLVVNHMELRRSDEHEAKNPFNYVRGMVYERPEKLQGHYADLNGVIGDECSGLQDEAWGAVQPMKKFLWVGNPSRKAAAKRNFFYRLASGGDVETADQLLERTGAA